MFYADGQFHILLLYAEHTGQKLIVANSLGAMIDTYLLNVIKDNDTKPIKYWHTELSKVPDNLLKAYGIAQEKLRYEQFVSAAQRAAAQYEKHFKRLPDMFKQCDEFIPADPDEEYDYSLMDEVGQRLDAEHHYGCKNCNMSKIALKHITYKELYDQSIVRSSA